MKNKLRKVKGCPFVRHLSCNMPVVCCASCLEVMLNYADSYQWVSGSVDKALECMAIDKRFRSERNALPDWII